MKRFLLILKRFFVGLSKLPRDIVEFGLNASFWRLVLYVLPSMRNVPYRKAMEKYLDKQFAPVTKQFNNNIHDADYHVPQNHIQPDKKPIWVCWLQGEDYMPELVKMCYRYLQRNKPEYAEIHLITLDNYKKYITLPDFVEEKFNKGQITKVHFTDIMRVHLLYAYGGLWIDSTVFTSRTLPDEFFMSRFYGQKMKDPNKYIHEPSRAQWSGFLMGGEKGNLLFCYLRNTLWYYWEKHTVLVEYLILDYCLVSAYKHFPEFKKDIDAIKPNNENLWEIWNHMEYAYDENLYNDIIKDTTFFKLSYKKELKKFTDSGNETFYNHLLEQSLNIYKEQK